MVTCQVKNVLSSHSSGPWPPKLGRVLNQDEWPHPKRHVTLQLCGQVKIKSVTFPQPQGRGDVKGKLALAKINIKMPTRTKNVEMK